MARQRPLLISSDTDLIDDVLRLASSHGVEVHLAAEPEGARSPWALAPLVIVGADAASAVASAHLSRRRDVVLVARDPTPETWRVAVDLGAEHVVSLPEAERWLIDRLADSTEGPARGGRVLAVVGTGGGAGASTFAATLAVVAEARGLRVLLVDADPTAGGLDVLLGIEERPGIRWPDLADSRGRLGADSLAGALPDAHGVPVLSWSRNGPGSTAVEGMAAVLDAGARGYDLVIVDVPRHADVCAELVLSRADETLLVVTDRVRSIAAAARLVALLGRQCSALSLVVRTQTHLDDDVLYSLGPPIIARLPSSPAVAARAEDGEPPSTRDAYAKACLLALREVAAGRGSAA